MVQKKTQRQPFIDSFIYGVCVRAKYRKARKTYIRGKSLHNHEQTALIVIFIARNHGLDVWIVPPDLETISSPASTSAIYDLSPGNLSDMSSLAPMTPVTIFSNVFQQLLC